MIRVAKEVDGVIEADVPDLALTIVPRTAWRRGTISAVTVEVV